jgi:hypothetical protein
MSDFALPRKMRPLVAAETWILDWMSKNNHPEYREQVNERQDHFLEVVGEAGPGGPHCEFTNERLDGIERDMTEIIQRAQDRYDDWASDGYE